MHSFTMSTTGGQVGMARRLVGSANCPKCTGKAENVEHAFRDCLTVKEIWGKLGIDWQQELNKGQFKDWMGERWRSPKESYVKINFDAAFHKQSKSSCSRIVVRDSSGRVLNFTMRLNEHIPTGFVAEAIACVQAVQLGVDLGIVKAEIEDNALSVIKWGYLGIKLVEEDIGFVRSFGLLREVPPVSSMSIDERTLSR
ncbi:hypothetical protein PVK06_042883 [Gossypium arboreum]|uniref:RNase H type-1 domain-containing protein n=1 Tax=Gossypium arboreum TaxID=29729 RepID=A0ABR0MME0_GOSAR|nr:hypothetical protein PVK06_042883 [Gossypium arboreum]